MGTLLEYRNLIEKEQFYNCTNIETENEFDEIFDPILANSEGYAFRSVKEAKFKLYSSAQRQWIWKDLSNRDTLFTDYIVDIIRQLRTNQEIQGFFNSNNISINDFVILALLQHYGRPSPLIDFTYSPLTTLFFAFDDVQITTNGTIDDYVSIYSFNYNQPCFCSIQDINAAAASNAEMLLNDADIPVDRIDTHTVTNQIQDLDYEQYPDLGPILVHGDSMGITNVAIPTLGFTCTYDITNPNLQNQKGLFMLNTSEDEPLGELLRNRHRHTQPLINCYNIRKELEPYIRNKHLTPQRIDRDMIYPQDLDSQNIKKWLPTFD